MFISDVFLYLWNKFIPAKYIDFKAFRYSRCVFLEKSQDTIIGNDNLFDFRCTSP